MFLISIRYSTIETKETARIEYNGFICAPWPSPEYSCGKRNPLYPIRAASFVSIIMYPILVVFKLLYYIRMHWLMKYVYTT